MTKNNLHQKFKENGNIDLSIAYLNTNWWHISELDIEINIVKDNGECYVFYDLELEEPLENFQIVNSKESKKSSCLKLILLKL